MATEAVAPAVTPEACPTLLQKVAVPTGVKTKKNSSSKTKAKKGKQTQDDDMLAMEEQLRFNDEYEKENQKGKAHHKMLKLFPALHKVEKIIPEELEPLVVALESAAAKRAPQAKLKKDMLLVEELVTAAMCTLDDCHDIGADNTARAYRKSLMGNLSALSKRAHVAAGVEMN